MQLHAPAIAVTRLAGGAVRRLRGVGAASPNRRRPAPARLAAALLYEGGTLVDANPAGWDMMIRLGTPSGLDSLVERLSPRFPDLRKEVAGQDGRTCLAAAQGRKGDLTVERVQGRVRLTLHDAADHPPPAEDGPRTSIDRRVLAFMEAELAELRAACDAAPVPVWLRPSAGRDPWRNSTARAEGIGDDAFDPDELARLVPGGPPERVRAADGRWWDLRLAEGGRHLAALPADAAVAAETTARGYATALVETFAQLPVGLAVFASDGRLRTFNPAFTDMTGLDPATLAARPALRVVFDRLREGGLVPDHADWSAWTARATRLERDSRGAGYLETWTLEDGRSWRVSGRPHPGGAVAFLIEDVTTEAELERRFQSELAIGQAIADAIPDALAVFAPSGTLLASNAAYAALWGTDPRVTLADADAAAAVRTWRRASQDDGAWSDVERRLGAAGTAPWTVRASGPEGPLDCEAVPIAGGATLLRFVPASGADGPNIGCGEHATA